MATGVTRVALRRLERAAALIFLAAGLPLAIPPSGSAAQAPARPHPRLVSAESARCTNCHEELVKGKISVHAPATDDCRTCHQVSVTPSGTTISLSEQQPALCLTCHDALEAAAKGKLKAAHAPVADSCTACHDPHGAAVPRLLKARGAALCSSCHDVSELQAKHGQQLTAATDCTRCHSPHGSDNAQLLAGSVKHAPFADKSCDACHRTPLGGRVRLQARVDNLCFSCHGDMPQSAPPGGSWHAALKAARGTPASSCLACHDPHLSANRKLLLRTGTALCAGCHGSVAKAAAGKGGHAPANDDCLSCHKPHAAAKPSLLSDTPRAVCAGCHDAADAALRKAHLGAALDALDCTSCHTPHGAGNAKALARYVHAPVTESCDACHQGSSSKLVEDGNPPLCLTCHDEVGQAAKSAKVQHAAMEAARCVDCHNAHASPRQRLVKLAAGGECTGCHEAQAAGSGETAHGAIVQIGCQGCHEPHGGSRPKLLRGVGNELCMSCHRPPATPFPAEGTVQLAGRFDLPASAARSLGLVLLTADGKRGHPVPNHPVATVASDPHARRSPDATTFKGELSCLTCHDPHKGKSQLLLRWGAGAAGEACVNCHKK